MTPLPSVFAHWFEQKGWQLRDYQHTMLVEKDQHDCTLLIAPTGAGKTLSGFLPSLVELAETFGMSELAEAFGTSELAEMSENGELVKETGTSEQAETKAINKQATNNNPEDVYFILSLWAPDLNMLDLNIGFFVKTACTDSWACPESQDLMKITP